MRRGSPVVNRRYVALAALIVGGPLFMAALYGLLGNASEMLSQVAIVLVLMGAGVLLVSQKPLAIKWPHPGVSAVVAIAVVLHGIECFAAKGPTSAGAAFFIWGLTPYALCALVSSISTLRAAPFAGGALALAVDLLVHVEVFIAPHSSTSALLLIYVPLWNILVFVPVGTIVAWLILRRRSRSASPQP
jgi:hypothetical protein